MVKQKKKKAGRPKKYPTKTVRIPKAIEEEVNELKLGYDLMWDGKTKTIHPMPSNDLDCPIPHTDYGDSSERFKDRTRTGKEKV